MAIIGLILLLVGVVLAYHLLVVVGLILLIVGLVLNFVPFGTRRYRVY